LFGASGIASEFHFNRPKYRRAVSAKLAALGVQSAFSQVPIGSLLNRLARIGKRSNRRSLAKLSLEM